MQSKRSTLISASLLLFTISAGIGAGRPADARQVLTGKERLSDKGSDEQRVDNCRVPPERRGVKPRPDCLGSPPSSQVASGRR